jgi:hypothetical protein
MKNGNEHAQQLYDFLWTYFAINELAKLISKNKYKIKKYTKMLEWAKELGDTYKQSIYTHYIEKFTKQIENCQWWIDYIKTLPEKMFQWSENLKEKYNKNQYPFPAHTI